MQPQAGMQAGRAISQVRENLLTMYLQDSASQAIWMSIGRADQILGREHDLTKAGLAHGLELGFKAGSAREGRVCLQAPPASTADTAARKPSK